MLRPIALTFLVLGPLACVDLAGPIAPDPVDIRPSIADASRGFRERFYWLPPLVESPALGGGVFDPGLSPTVRICELAGAMCGPVVATFTMTSGSGSETVRLDAAAEHYVVNWHTREFGLDATSRYRISVHAGPGVLLGYLDAQPVTAGTRQTLDASDAIALVIGRTLPIKFRIETGIVGQIDVSPAEASIAASATQQFVATAYDLHGSAVGASVTWSSSNTSVATVDASGLATGVSAGTATIIATAAGVSGSGELSVRGAFAMVSAGDRHTCGVTVAGAVYCWGDNGFGQLGNGSTTGSPTPIQVSGGLTFSAVTAGGNHTCGLTTAGGVYCWGSDASGQLGNGIGGSSAIPTPVSGGLTFAALTAGTTHTCGVTTTGAGYCWGPNNAGELGTGSYSPATIPVPVSGNLTFSAISAGLFHTCGITTSGLALCWGLGDSGRLGNGLFANNPTPTVVSGGLLFTAVTAGYAHSCGVTTTAAAYCWGANGVGALGTGSTTSSAVPVAVSGGRTFSQLSAGQEYSCGVTGGGTAYCWGSNTAGQLGDGSTTTRLAPQPLAGGISFTAVSAGSGASASAPHTCGVTAAGSAYCWGSNTFGQLGDGSTVNKAVPVAVIFP